MDVNQAGGSVTELAPFLDGYRELLGKDYLGVHFFSKMQDGVDIFTKGEIVYGMVASITLGLGVKTEGNLVISGTKGYVLVPSLGG
ncbi:MAG: hypothetical protein ACLU4N_10685 [Butyricimonas faecihominis]